MSADQLDGELAGPLAQPAVDILPMAGGRKGKPAAAEPEPPHVLQPPAAPEPAPEAAPEDAYHAAVAPSAQVNPWTGVPTDAATTPQPVPILPITSVTPVSMEPFAAVAEEPKKFFGMQVRRGKKATQAAPEAASERAPALDPVTDAPPAADAHDAVIAPVAAWPTDVGVPAVADAEPTAAAGGYAAPASFAPIDLFSTAHADAPPAQAPLAFAAPAPVEVSEPPGPLEPDATAPAEAAVIVPSVDTAARDTTTGPAAEVKALRALLEASDAERVAAETRADHAVEYAQQTQGRLQQLEADGQARVQAAEVRARTAANEAQDWQIRHREAETTISELAASVAGSEERMAELRTECDELRAERDELLSSLEDATAPASESHTQPSS